MAGVSSWGTKTHAPTPPKQHKQAVVFVAYAPWLLIFYTLAVLVLRYAFDVELPNPFKLLPSHWRHYLGYLQSLFPGSTHRMTQRRTSNSCRQESRPTTKVKNEQLHIDENTKQELLVELLFKNRPYDVAGSCVTKRIWKL